MCNELSVYINNVEIYFPFHKSHMQCLLFLSFIGPFMLTVFRITHLVEQVEINIM